MTHVLLAFFLALTFTVPPAAKMIFVLGVVYGVLQALKKVPQFTASLTGWWAMAFNLAFSIIGVLVTVPAGQFYTSSTFNSVMQVVLVFFGAAGIHGTVRSLSKPTVLAETPPDGAVKEVPATLVPNDPANVPVGK